MSNCKNQISDLQPKISKSERMNLDRNDQKRRKATGNVLEATRKSLRNRLTSNFDEYQTR